jgi:hypothetical protein
MRWHGRGRRNRLREFVAVLVARLVGKSDLGERKTDGMRQLTEEIMGHARMVSKYVGHQTIGVEVDELAFRLRETTYNIVTALIVLEKQGRANRARTAGHWKLHAQPLGTYNEVSESNDNRTQVRP